MNRWAFFAGLGMIRFGMEMFEEGIKKLGGPKLRNILQQYTDKGRKATLVGTVVTGILNSSTLVSLLALGFVSTGMMKLLNAVGILAGANIGSTATGLIVGYLGFGEFKIATFALPLIAIGGVIMIFTSKKYRGYRSKMFIGFGLFFLGIGFLKDNVELMSEIFNFAQYKESSLWIFGFVGMIMTAMIQSSGAVGVMTLAALSAGIVTFDAGFAIILGANIGTTFTALIASLSGSSAKRQMGIANVLFNIFTVIFGLIFFNQFIRFTLEILGYKDDIVIGNAIINFVFNVVTSILFIPFLKPFTRLIQWLIPERQTQYPLQVLKHDIALSEKYDSDMATTLFSSLEQDRIYMTSQVMEYMSDIWGIDRSLLSKSTSDILSRKFDAEQHEKLFHHLQEQFDIVFSVIQSLSKSTLSHEHSVTLQSLSTSFLRLSNTSKSMESIQEDILVMRSSLDKNLHMIYLELASIVIDANRAVEKNKNFPDIVDSMRDYRNSILSHVQDRVVKGNIGDLDLSSLVNMTAEMVDAVKSLEKSQK